MRTIRSLPITQDGNNALFPDGQIKNKTALEDGTPVVREVYGDPLTNIYAIIKDAGINFNGLEDNEVNGYQLLKALKVFANEINDIKKIITVSGTNISVGFNFDTLPEDYIFFAQVSEDVLKGVNYNFIGAGTDSYIATTQTNITASGIVAFIINSAGCKIVGISQSESISNTLDVSFGIPLTFSEKSIPWYFQEGVLFNNNPKSYLVENAIQVLEASVDFKVLDVIFHKGKLICLALDTANDAYEVYSFDENTLSVVEGVVTVDKTGGADKQPYMFCDGTNVYFTNSDTGINSLDDDFSIGKFVFDAGARTLTHVSTIALHAGYEKTTNSFIKDNQLFTYVAGTLYKYLLDGTAARTFVDSFPGSSGRVFSMNGEIYFSSGETAIKWNV